MKLSIVYALVPRTKFRAAIVAPLESVLKLASEEGVNGIEFNIPNPFEVNVTELERKLSDYNLELSALSTGLSYLEYGYSLTHPNEELRKKSIEFFVKYCEIAHRLSKYNRVVIGLARGRSEGRSREEVLNILRKSIEEILKRTESYGTTLLVEPINHYETDILNKLDETIEFIKSIGSPRVKLLLDTYHSTIEEKSPYDAIVKAREYIGYVHVAENNRLAPGMGMLDWERIIYRLIAVGYNDYLSIECIPYPTYEEMVKTGVETLRRVLELRY